MRSTARALVIIALSTVLLASGCGLAEVVSPTSENVDVVVELINGHTAEGGEVIHILRPGEAFAPSNRLDPGGRRVVTVGLNPEDGVEFRAGRNGQVITSVTCYSEDAEALRGTTAIVTWNASRLVCSGWDA